MRDMEQIGVIGIGFVGANHCRRLLKHGHEIVAFEKNPLSVDADIKPEITLVDTPGEVARRASVIILSLPGSPQVSSVMEESDGILDSLQDNTIVIDTTTTLPHTAGRFEELCRERAAHFVSAPLTFYGDPDGPKLMVGATDKNYRISKQYLDTISVAHIRIGDVEEGLKFKLLMQLRLILRDGIDSEIIAFGNVLGVKPKLLNEFLGMNIRPSLFDQEYRKTKTGLGTFALKQKDLKYARELANGHGSILPMTNVVTDAFHYSSRQASPEESNISLINSFWSDLNRL